MEQKLYAYVLKIEKVNQVNFYVGTSQDVEKRIEQHKKGKGSQFLNQLLSNKYKLDYIKIEIQNYLDEDYITELLMILYGGQKFENVRGGTYCKSNLDEYQIKFLEKKQLSFFGQCYNCGSKDHFQSSKECQGPQENKEFVILTNIQKKQYFLQALKSQYKFLQENEIQYEEQMKIDVYDAQCCSLENQNEQLKNELILAEQKCKQLSDQNQQLKSIISSKDQEIQQLLNEKGQYQQEIHNLKDEIDVQQHKEALQDLISSQESHILISQTEQIHSQKNNNMSQKSNKSIKSLSINSNSRQIKKQKVPNQTLILNQQNYFQNK